MPRSLNRKSCSGLVISGGASRRMRGRNKARIRLTPRGPTQEERSVALLRTLADTVYIANGKTGRKTTFGARYIHQPAYRQQGPLEGLAAAAKAVRTPWVWVIPVDSLVTADTLRLLRMPRGGQPAYLSANGRHSLCLLLPRWALVQSRFILEKHEQRVSVYLRKIEACPVRTHPSRLRNLNQPSDWRQARWRRNP